jgi:hypothetical protein
MTKIIDVSDQAEPLPKGYNFSCSEDRLGPDASVFDSGSIAQMERPEMIGIAIKHRDPTDVLSIRFFIARHGLAKLAGFAPVVRRIGQALGLTRCPQGAVNTERGERSVTPYEEARLRYYPPVIGEAAYRAQETIRNNAGVYADRLSVTASAMSLGDGKYSRLSRNDRRVVAESQKLPKEGKLPERHCQNPECLKEIKPGRHHNIKYCNDTCTARAKEFRRLQKSRQPLYRNEPCATVDFPNDINQLDPIVVPPHMSIGIISKDRPAKVPVYQ